MNYRFAVSIPAPGLVGIARQAEEHGLTVTVVSRDPDDGDGVILSVQHERDEREEAQELEDLATQAWEEYYED
jgi:hypothetical protein